MKTKFFFFTILFLPLLAHSFQDPHGLMPELESYLGKPKFADSFRDNYKFESEHLSCLGSAVCDKMRVHYEIKQSDEETAIVYTYVGTGAKPNSEATVKKAAWESIFGNLLRRDIAFAESFGNEVILDSLTPSSVTIKVNGAEKTYQAMEISYRVVSKLGALSTITAKVVKEIPGPGQIAQEVKIQEAFGRSRDIKNLVQFLY